MDLADKISNLQVTGNGADTTARAAALRARIRELHDVASGDNTPIEGAANASDTQPASTTEITSNEFAELARSINRNHIGTIPSAPAGELAVAVHLSSPSRWQRWSAPRLAPKTASAACAVRRSIRDWIKCTPSWLISAVFHGLLLVTLALLSYSQTAVAPAIIIAGDQADFEIVPERVNDVEIGAPEDDLEEPLWQVNQWSRDVLDAGPPQINVSNELTAPDFSAQLALGSVLSEQLSAAQTTTGRGNHGGGAQFYGIQATGDRFVFIVDSSTSMTLKFAEAKRELEYAVRGLQQDQQFYVIFFDRNTERLRLGKWNKRGTRYSMNNRPERNLVPASDENINALIYWMNMIQLDSDTNPYPAVVYALRILKPDAIFLLSDGEFNDNGSTEAFLQRENIIDDPINGPRPKTIVHCVGFYSRRGEITLKRIAKAHDGSYRFIEPPHR